MTLQFNILIVNISKWSCRFHIYIKNWSAILSAWIITFIAIDRCYAVSVPHKHKMLFTRRKISYVLVTFIFLSFALHSFYLYGLDHLLRFVPEANRYVTICTTSEKYILISKIFLWTQLVLFSVIPSFIIIFCNACVIYKACLSNRRWQHGEERSSKLAGMTGTLMLVSISHFLLSSPVSFTLILFEMDMISDFDFKFMMNISLVLSEINHAVNFFLYCITGSKFRNEIKLMFTGKI